MDSEQVSIHSVISSEIPATTTSEIQHTTNTGKFIGKLASAFSSKHDFHTVVILLESLADIIIPFM